MKNAEAHEIQILFTEVTKDAKGMPVFLESAYNVNEKNHFYPASTTKLPIVALTLQKIKELNALGIPINTTTAFEIRDRKGALIVAEDSTQKRGKVTIAHLIKKVFLVSDNDAYNYLFDFLGRDYIYAELKKKGLNNSQILHKFLLGADNTTTWEYTFFNEAGTQVYHQESIKATLVFSSLKLNGLLKGDGFISEGKLIKEPMDFSEKNALSIRDIDGILKRLIYPEAFPKGAQFDLRPADYTFLQYWMSRSALESEFPNYNDGNYWDSYGKFLIYGDQKGVMNNGLRSYNKVGYAYGTLTDVAYIQDRRNDLEFFLTATVLVNENRIFNDDVYEFESKGIPFLAALGRGILKELQEKKKGL
tara:strand:+ start:1921 stop:3006 length:1086 start_codon:yes stop_codon:yes gene_type:complete